MDPYEHALEYAKTGRARCHGGCGSNIDKGALRYGKKYMNPRYGEGISWSHWECVSKAKLAKVALHQVPGFRRLSFEDQERVRHDVKGRRNLPQETPSSSQTNSEPPSSQITGIQSSSQAHSTQPSTGQKRKRREETRDNLDEDDCFDESREEVKDELYISLASQIVGLQYYGGLVGPGEEVTLVREPHNKYDRNAIQVLNISGAQVGHIPRKIAEKLAPLIDSNQIAVEGIINEGNIGRKSQYTISIKLKIYGASHRRAQLEPLLTWATPGQRGFTNAMRSNNYEDVPFDSQATASTSASGRSEARLKAHQDKMAALQKAAELKSLLSSLEKVDDEGRRGSLLDIVCPTEDLLNMPTHPDPPSIANGQLKVDLLRHQGQALQWCLERENPGLPRNESDRPVQFWQYKKGVGKNQAFYMNLITHTPQANPPELGRGGLMADAMGLGKTLTMLALIAATKADVPTDFSNATLIVVPVSVMSNWRSQIDDHIAHGFLTHHLYYESGRSMSSEKLATYDVVITSYQTVAADFAASGNETRNKKKKLERGLFGVKWKRIILDEGHMIRNPKTKMSIAIKSLQAERRWVVSGTPIINSPRDLGSLLQFLHICCPLDNEEYFKRLILRPIAQGDPQGAELLKALMSYICIRRTKEMQNERGEYLVPLPPVEMTLVPVKLDPVTRTLYDEIEALSQQWFNSMIEVHTRSGSTSMPVNVLALLTRLRQLALHPGLIPRNYLEELRTMVSGADAPPAPAIPITPQDRIRLQMVLARAIEDSEECPICFEISNDPRITPCAHIYCLACITEVILRDPRCPMDRRTINMLDLIPPPPPTDLTQALPAQEEEEETPTSSAKIDQLVHLLQLTPSNEKSLVFSQFTSFLEKIADALDEAGIPYVKFDGQMSARRRQEVLEKFSRPLEEPEHLASSQNDYETIRRPRRSLRKQTIEDGVDEDGVGTDVEFVFSDSGAESSENNWSKNGKGKDKERGAKSKLKGKYDFSANQKNPVVMLISLKAGALGLNLTVANNVFLMDPWWQEGIESQAIDRCNRIGQKKSVHVYQLVAEDTVEAKVLEIQERKKTLIREAFSGLRSTETQRQKKEARLQDLIELFRARRNDNSQISA